MKGFAGKKHTAQSKRRMSNQKLGERNPQSKPVIHVDTGKEYPCVRACAKELDISSQSIRNVCAGKWKQARGQKFEYIGG